MPDVVAFHFQEFFRGNEVEILVNGEPRAKFVATTRPQIGLARVEDVPAEAGDSVTVRVAGAGEKTVRIVNGITYWRVSLGDDKLSIEPGRDSPGYM